MSRKNVIQANEIFLILLNEKMSISITTFLLTEAVNRTHTYQPDWQTRTGHAILSPHKPELSQLYRIEHVKVQCSDVKQKQTKKSPKNHQTQKNPYPNKQSIKMYIFYRSLQNIFNQVSGQLCSPLWSILPFKDFKTKALNLVLKKVLKLLTLHVHTISRSKSIHQPWIYN